MDKFDHAMRRWNEDPSFREIFRNDPEQAMVYLGYELSRDEREVLRSVDLSGSDEELAQRAAAKKNC